MSGLRIAFTAPMKPLDDPRPSGDRTFARLIVRALESAGHTVRVASRFASWRQAGSELPEAKVAALAEAARVEADWRAEGYRPDVFLTYHLYHKAPDWIGPALSNAFDIPYAVMEASRAPKRATGDWAFGFAAADAALGQADAVGAIHRADMGCLAAALPPDRLYLLPPFLDATPFQAQHRIQRDAGYGVPVRLLSVGMMRHGDKERSYRVLAEALGRLSTRNWHLTIVGDGPARAEIEALFPPHRCSFLGALPPEDLPAVYADHDLFVWPAIREAFGFVFLEAQASGLPVVGGATFGVPDVVADGETGLLAPEGDVEGFATALQRLLSDAALRQQMGVAASRHIRERHTLEAGAARLTAFLDAAIATRSKAGARAS
ncbi:glycosyltransferase family 4 protein [Pannonibacter tanglangensis]